MMIRNPVAVPEFNIKKGRAAARPSFMQFLRILAYSSGGSLVTLFIGPVKHGIIPKATYYIGLCGGHPTADQPMGLDHPLDSDIFPNRCAHGLLENSAKLGLTDIKVLTKLLQR